MREVCPARIQQEASYDLGLRESYQWQALAWGEKAVHDSVLLSENEVGYVWPACKSAMFESPNVCVLDTVDGTALRMGMFLGTES